jgi:hypothetical protein
MIQRIFKGAGNPPTPPPEKQEEPQPQNIIERRPSIAGTSSDHTVLETHENQYDEYGNDSATVQSEEKEKTHPIGVKSEAYKANPNKRPNYKYIDFLENKINQDIAWYYWKKYVAAAFWTQISMPINFTITLITALTTAQANSPTILSENIYKNISIVALILTVVNTFFKPYEKAQKNVEYMKRWNMVGIEFEKIYYSDKNTDYNKHTTGQSLIENYTKVKDKIGELRQKEGPETQNFLTDFVTLLCRSTCLRNKRFWIPHAAYRMGREAVYKMEMEEQEQDAE